MIAATFLIIHICISPYPMLLHVQFVQVFSNLILFQQGLGLLSSFWAQRHGITEGQLYKRRQSKKSKKLLTRLAFSMSFGNSSPAPFSSGSTFTFLPFLSVLLYKPFLLPFVSLLRQHHVGFVFPYRILACSDCHCIFLLAHLSLFSTLRCLFSITEFK